MLNFRYVRVGKRTLLPVLIAALFLTACKSRKAGQISARKESPEIKVTLQERREYTFGDAGFSNMFASSRANSIVQENDSTYSIRILPENTPINNSPWYAFKIWSQKEGPAIIKLSYQGVKHRYNPKFYKSGEPVTASKVTLNRDSTEASFRVHLSKDTLLISAQEIIGAADSYRWMDSLSKASALDKEIIGYSIGGRPIVALNTRGSDGKKLVLVLSRQHPPEVTGYMAMQEFVKTVTSSSDLSRRFLASFQMIIIPMINPDGVDEGHWRHSLAGVDLNRDWIDFKQPETRAVRDYVLKKTKSQNAKTWFGIDFHSTFHDVFYTNRDPEGKPTNAPGFTAQWLQVFQDELNFKANIRPSGNGGNVSKSWMGRELNADALTYEVGDKTPREQLKKKGRVAAELMMKLLLERETHSKHK